MMEKKLWALFLILLSAISKIAMQSELVFLHENDTSNAVHSRRKRFLVFPQGSSLQLVFCLTIPSIGMGNIFTIGWTAALAWELPHEPIHPFKKKGGALQRVDTPGSSTSGGWAVQKGPTSTSDRIKKKTYYDFPSLNYPSSPYATIKDYLTKPGYSQMRYTGSSADTSYREQFKGKDVDYRRIYDSPTFRSSLKSNNVMKEVPSLHWHPAFKEVHRRTRRDLFSKIEKFLEAQRLDGKACLLKAICEVSKASANEVGTFMEEIIKAIFRLKPYRNVNHHDDYDKAAEEENCNCTEKYSRCSSSVWSML